MDTPSSADIRVSLESAWSKRDALHSCLDLDVYRVYHGYTEGITGVEIDRYGDVAIIRCRSKDRPVLPILKDFLLEQNIFTHIVAKARQHPIEMLHGEMPDSPHVVQEHGLKMNIEAWQPRNPGLFLDARLARQWISKHSKDRRILNLFCFTGSLGITAALNGAKGVTQVDSQKKMLERCASNHQLNGCPVDNRDLVRLNIYKHIGRMNKGPRYGGIIVDPPPYEPSGQKPSSMGYGSVALAPICADMLEPGGWMLCFFHYGETYEHDEETILDKGDGKVSVMWRGSSDIDFPEVDITKKLRVTVFQRA